MSKRQTCWTILACILSITVTGNAQLFEPSVDNPSFEYPDLGTSGDGDYEDYVEDWAINASGYCYLEDGSWEIVAPNGVNVLKMWSGATVWQQIGTWTANTNYEVGLWIGRGDDSTAVDVEFWVGGDADEMPASDFGYIEDTVGATEVSSETLTPTVSEGESEWMTAVLNTGTGYTAGAALWIRIECAADSDEAAWIDDVQVGYVTDPALASSPSPGDGEDDVALDTSLSWTAGKYAVTHDVYFGTSYDDVNDASRDNQENVEVSLYQSETSFSPEELTLDQTYYWRVDEVNEDPSIFFKGTIWSFEAEPTYFKETPASVTASSWASDEYEPNNTINESGLEDDLHAITTESGMWKSATGDVDGAWIQYEFETLQKLGLLLVWNANPIYENILGVGVKEAVIATSLDGETWTELDGTLTFNQGTGQNEYAANTTIDLGGVTAKYVKFNIISHWADLTDNVGLSEVRFMVIPAAARLPQPTSETTIEGIFDELTWRSGRDAEQHTLYLDMNETLVTDSDSSTLKATLTERSYDLSEADLLYGETYFWKVVETAGEEVADGTVWEFTTPEYLVIDNMESYSSDVNIFESWVDGVGDKTNGSMAGHKTSPYVEQEIAFDETSQSLPFYYENKGKATISTATMDLGGQNWEAGGLQTLVLYFLGDEDNDEATFFVEIDGQRIESEASLVLPIWKQMAIELNSLNIDLTNVESFTIGVDGDGDGDGTIYIDEIRVCREVHVVEDPINPDDTGLIVYYDMEGNLDNQAGNAYDGVEEGTVLYNSKDSVNDSLNKSVIFNGTDTYIDIPDLGELMPTLSDSSFSAWVNIDEDATGSWMRVFDFGTGTENYLFLCPRTDTAGEVRAAILTQAMTDAGISEIGVTSDSSLTDGWHHVACVFASNVLTLYVDGWSAGSVETDGLPQDLGDTTQNWLGESQWDSDDLLMGLMDEFRIYNRALSEGEIRYLAGDR